MTTDEWAIGSRRAREALARWARAEAGDRAKAVEERRATLDGALAEARERPASRRLRIDAAHAAHAYWSVRVYAALVAAAGVAAVTASQTPLDTYPVAVPETGGTIIITPCPGKRQRDLGLDLDQLKGMGAEAIITMVQDRELDLLSVRDIGEKCEERGLIWLHCPIPDFDGPGAAFERAWADGAGERARAILRRGGTVVSHCRGGIGRAGTVASRLLIELGAATPDEALRRVRTARPGAVETWEQEQHVLSCRAVD